MNREINCIALKDCCYLHPMSKQLIFLIFLTVFASCGEESKSEKKAKKLTIKKTLLNLTHCFTPEESNISFPIWFNDSIVRQKKIKSITRSFFTNESGSTEDGLREVRYYEFDENGQITAHSIKQIYEHAEVGELIFKYKEGVDEYGYGHVEVIDKFKNESIADQFKLYKKDSYSAKYLVYSNEENGNYLFYMKNEVNWGPLSVDSILHPTPDDIIVYGTPRKPVKHYQVENRVKEFNVMSVDYHGKGDDVVGLKFDKYPLEYRRSFEYLSNGKCKGFIDSTFSGDQYLTRRVSKIELNELGVPNVVRHVNQVEGNKKGYTEVEKFEYEFYEEDK